MVIISSVEVAPRTREEHVNLNWFRAKPVAGATAKAESSEKSSLVPGMRS